MMRGVLICVPMLALAACGTLPGGDPATKGPVPRVALAGYASGVDASGALLVTREATPFRQDEGAEARRSADAICGGHVASSINDHYRDGAWVFPKGCA